MSGYGQGRGGRPWRRIVERVRIRDEYTCRKCGRVTESGEVDHIVPVARGGTDDPSNLQYLCGGPGGCHAEKTRQEMGQRQIVRVGPDGWPVEQGDED